MSFCVVRVQYDENILLLYTVRTRTLSVEDSGFFFAISFAKTPIKTEAPVIVNRRINDYIDSKRKSLTMPSSKKRSRTIFDDTSGRRKSKSKRKSSSAAVLYDEDLGDVGLKHKSSSKPPSSISELKVTQQEKQLRNDRKVLSKIMCSLWEGTSVCFSLLKLASSRVKTQV